MDILFSKDSLENYLEHRNQSMRQAIDQIEESQFISSSEEQILEHVRSKFQLSPIILYEDQTEKEMEESEIVRRRTADQYWRDEGDTYKSKSFKITYNIPFSGDIELWYLRPMRYSVGDVYGELTYPGKNGLGAIRIIVEVPIDTPPESVPATIEQKLIPIRFNLSEMKNQIATSEFGIDGVVKDSILLRKKRIEQKTALQKAINIPLVKRPQAPSLDVHLVRKLVRPLPAVKSQPQEHQIADADYEHILKVIQHGGATFEATPATLAKLDEEELRDLIVAQLNGHYNGLATGETFRKKGKTDIRIEVENRAAFVGECKVWRGEKELKEAIKQLSGYLTWRDCKASIILFNKQVSGFKGLFSKITEVLKNHEWYISDVQGKSGPEWRVRIRSMEDEAHVITLHVFLFNIYVPSK